MNSGTLEIRCDELLQRRNAGASLRLVDCRERDEWNFCRIEGAELIALSEFAAEAPRRFAGEQRPIVVYCHHGMRSMQAVRMLRALGVENAWSLAGGIDQWSRDIDPAVPRY
ncbi:MAG: rhodanese [Verrucomicrobiales bacterium]|nr:rhodanese [Verrucomicrobiales bacterium]